MKNTLFKILAMLVVVVILFSFTVFKAATITGRVTPAEGLKDVWAVSQSDTARGTVSQGNFMIENVKPGTYKVIIDANAPYKDIVKEAVSVVEGQPVDMGEIKLEK